MRYTDCKENDLFSSIQFDNGEDDYTDVLNYLYQDFRTFGDGLLALAEKKEGKTIDTPPAYIKQKCKEAGIDISLLGSEPTIRKWFSQDIRPKKGEDSRRKLFVLAFTLGLSVDETKYLFQRIYLDRAFNQRDYREFIYYYCLNNHLSLHAADELIGQVSIDAAKKDDETVYTSYLENEVAELHGAAEILEFIHSHAHNFSVDTKSAKRELLTIKQSALHYAQLEADSEWDKTVFNGQDRTSDSFLYSLITQLSVAGKKGTVTIPFKNTVLPAEIKTNFPQVKSFSEKVDSTEELRKSIILLFSYVFWSQAKDSGIADCDLYDEYHDQLNDLLERAGLPTMYYGNPFDWLFLYCAYNENPLDIFRGVLAWVLDEAE